VFDVFSLRGPTPQPDSLVLSDKHVEVAFTPGRLPHLVERQESADQPRGRWSRRPSCLTRSRSPAAVPGFVAAGAFGGSIICRSRDRRWNAAEHWRPST